MAKHTDILEAFTTKMFEHSIGTTTVANHDVAESASSAAINGAAPTTAQLVDIFDEDDESHALTMVILLKMCDISTEIRPVDVARPWLMGLINELTNQVSRWRLPKPLANCDEILESIWSSFFVSLKALSSHTPGSFYI